MTETDAYRTLTGPSESLFKDRGSKHYGFAFPVSSEQEVKEKLESIAGLHSQARHIAYAYRLEADGSVYRSSDAGEPKHSAGTPILGQLRSQDITFALVAVVRYFGGTKLGVPGLIHAYKTAAKLALDNNRIEVRYVLHYGRVQCAYDQLGSVMQLIESYDATLVDQQFDTACTVVLGIRATRAERLWHALQTIPTLTLQYPIDL